MVNSELSFKDDEPTGCSIGPEIQHPYHWHVRFGVLWEDVFVRHDRIRRVTTVATRPSSGRMTTRLVVVSGCTSQSTSSHPRNLEDSLLVIDQRQLRPCRSANLGLFQFTPTKKCRHSFFEARKELETYHAFMPHGQNQYA